MLTDGEGRGRGGGGVGQTVGMCRGSVSRLVGLDLWVQVMNCWFITLCDE
jgi:hypothetical protein